MYEAFFGLTKRPFASTPCVEQYYPAAAIEAARQTLVRSIGRAEGPAMVVGPSGTGKTLLCQVLAGHFKGQFEVVPVTGGGLRTRRALSQAILYGLGQPYRGMDEGELRLAILDHLSGERASPAGMLLLVDEAHLLPLKLLDEVRVLAGVTHGGDARARLVLAGGPVLEERLAHPNLESLSQRLAARCYLEPLSRSETEGYIHAQLQKAGGRPDEVFPPQSCQSVYQATDGVPRLINRVCDHVLLLAFSAGKPAVQPGHVEEAWADLQQLPAPWNGETRSDKSAPAVIEFGGLEDDAHEAGAPADTATPSDAPRSEPMAAQTAAVRDPTSPEPAERLQQIETLISRIQDPPQDFQPAGPGGPEVELIIEDFGNPFEESFREEEIVVDRFAACVSRGTRDEGRGTRDEGRGATDEARGMTEAGPWESATHPPACWENAYVPAGVAAMESRAAATESRAADAAPTTEDLPEADEAPPQDTADQGEVVEHGCEVAAPAPGVPSGPVRKRKYGQLFARLRSSGAHAGR